MLKTESEKALPVQVVEDGIDIVIIQVRSRERGERRSWRERKHEREREREREGAAIAGR
jgi:hypothetical protein